jgi:hypothetical protein
MFGQRAEFAFRVIVRFNSERPIESRAAVLPTDDGAQFGELAFRKLCAQGRIESVGNIGGGARKRDRQLQSEFFARVEMRAGFELGEIAKLILSEAGSSAHGRMNVNSKRAADHHGHLQLSQFLDGQRQDAL